MSHAYPINRRELLQLAGAGIALGTLGTGLARAGDGRYVVGTASRAAFREARGRATSVTRVFDFGGRGQAVAGQFSHEALRSLSRRADVRYVEPDGLMYAIGGVSDIDSADSEVPWGVDRVDAEKVHATSTGSGAHVAIVDTGIDSDHPDLLANLADPSVDGNHVAFVSARGPYPYPWDDDNGHGTHCSGTAAAVRDSTGVVGVAPAATLHAVKVLDKNGSGTWSDVAAGIQHVADKGWDVASMSLGGGKSKVVEDACVYAYDRGVILIAAAGNSGEDVKNSAPAAYATVVAVSATDSSDGTPDWSNFGQDIELAAPGVDVTSTYPGGGYRTYSGTSMACPHVSGGAAYLMAAGYSNADARTTLHATAEDLGATGHDTTYGHGLLDVEAIVAAISGGTVDTNPAVTTDAPTNVTATGATLNGSLTDLGGAASADVGFEFRESGASTWTATAAQTLSSTGSFSHDLADLIDGASYEYRAVATASDGDTATGPQVSFTTTDDPVVVTTGTASNVGDTGATLSGSLDDLGGAATADVGFEYRPVGGVWTATATATVSAVGGYTRDVTDLSAGTDYEFRAVATGSDGDAAAGSPVPFSTTGTATASAPSVSATATEAGSPNPHAEITVDWTVTDADADLTSVVVDVTAVDGNPTDSHSYTYSGIGSASGSDYFKFTHVGSEAFDVTVTATDATGGSAAWTGSVSS